MTYTYMLYYILYIHNTIMQILCIKHLALCLPLQYTHVCVYVSDAILNSRRASWRHQYETMICAHI